MLAAFFGGKSAVDSRHSSRNGSSRTSSTRSAGSVRKELSSSKDVPTKMWWAAEVEEERLIERSEKHERRHNIATVTVAAEEERSRRVREVLLQRALEGVEREEQRVIVKAMEDAERERRVREEQDAVRDSREEQIRNRGDAQAVVEAERERQIGMYMMAQAEIQAAKERQHKLQVAGSLIGRDLDSNVYVGHVASRQALLSAAPIAPDRDADLKSANVDGEKTAADSILTVDISGTDTARNDKDLNALPSPWAETEAETPTPHTSDFAGMWEDTNTMPVTSFSHRYRSRIPPSVDELATPMSSYSADSREFPESVATTGQFVGGAASAVSAAPEPENSSLYSFVSPAASHTGTKQALFATPGLQGDPKTGLLASADEITQKVLMRAMSGGGMQTSASPAIGSNSGRVGGSSRWPGDISKPSHHKGSLETLEQAKERGSRSGNEWLPDYVKPSDEQLNAHEIRLPLVETSVEVASLASAVPGKASHSSIWGNDVESETERILNSLGVHPPGPRATRPVTKA